MTTRRLVQTILVLSLVASACTGGGAKKAEAPLVRAAGPIVEMVPATTFDEHGRPVDPKFTFTPDEPMVTVIVQVGEVHGSPVDLTWYQVTDQGDKELFKDTVEVSTWDRAYSVGKNVGTFTPGTYRVTAKLEGRTQSVEWAVADDQGSPESEPGFDEQGSLPARGGSGTITRPQGSNVGTSGYPWGQRASTASGCRVDVWGLDGVNRETIQPTADRVWFGSDMSDCPDDSVAVVSATVGNTPASVVAVFNPQDQSTTGLINPCGLASKTDLPGTHIQLAATVIHGAGGAPKIGDPMPEGLQGPSAITRVTLGNDTSKPDARVVSKPARGTRVKPGDKITLDITGSEKRVGPLVSVSWQTGVKDIQVIRTGAGGKAEELVAQSPVYGGVAKACDAKSWSQPFSATYTVPSNPPPVIRLCAVAEDFAGNRGTNCGEFFTVERWKGTFDVVAEHDEECCVYRKGGYHGNLEFTVHTGGGIFGQGSATLTDASGCGDVANNLDFAEPYTRIRFYVSGRAFGDHLQLQLKYITGTGTPKPDGEISRYICGGLGEPLYVDFDQPLIVPITGNGVAQGEGAVDSRGGFSGSHSIRLTCQGCTEGS